MNDNGQMYIIEPPQDESGAKMRASKTYQATMTEFEYAGNYFKEHGTPWLSFYPRAVPILNIWPASQIGQSHHVFSKHGFWTCDPKGATQHGCQSSEIVPIKVEAVASSPRVFVLEDLMSDFECSHIRELGEKVIHRSTVGDGGSAYQSKTRTSSHGWLQRSNSPILESIFGRFADAMGIDDDKLHHGQNAEHLQVVRYEDGQEYTPHHDFGYTGRPNQRFLTLLLYIDVPEKGGATSFPKAHGEYQQCHFYFILSYD